MSNENKIEWFRRSVMNAFNVASFQTEDFRYTPPAQEHPAGMPAFIIDQLNGKKKKDPWGNGWHNGFPPGSQA